MYDKLMKGYLKNNGILKYFLKYEFSHFQKVCMNVVHILSTYKAFF